jgi:hypothetical protein
LIKVYLAEWLQRFIAFFTDLNSKQFGDFGGIKLILEMFSECCMDASDKTQAALTLAHAVDAYSMYDLKILYGVIDSYYCPSHFYTGLKANQC